MQKNKIKAILKKKNKKPITCLSLYSKTVAEIADKYSFPEKQSSTPPPALSTIAEFSNKAYVPDVRGLSMRKAMKTLSELGLIPRTQGSGKVSSQSLRPNTLVNKGTVCVVKLK